MFHQLIELFLKLFKRRETTGTVVEPKWLTIARGEIGVKEKRGGEHPRILEYHSATELSADEDEVPWCSSFVNWCMREAGLPRTKSALARSWLKYGQKSSPRLGAIVVFWRGSKTSSTGHVAFYLGEDGENVKVLGGNQSDSVCVATYPKSRVLDYRYPL